MLKMSRRRPEEESKMSRRYAKDMSNHNRIQGSHHSGFGYRSSVTCHSSFGKKQCTSNRHEPAYCDCQLLLRSSVFGHCSSVTRQSILRVCVLPTSFIAMTRLRASSFLLPASSVFFSVFFRLFSNKILVSICLKEKNTIFAPFLSNLLSDTGAVNIAGNN